MPDRFSADPTVVFMTSVLEDIGEGRLRIPRFQRPLVWQWSNRRDLLSSVFEGLPIGALMIWVSEGEEVSTYTSLGPHSLPSMPNVGESRYLMDGVQRISTLYGALKAQQDWNDYDPLEAVEFQDFVVCADLEAEREEDRFVRKVDVDDADLQGDPSRFLPLNILLDSKELIRFQRSIPKEHEARIDRADELAGAFRNYKIPLITLKSASLEVVTKSFERVNSRGADMSELHMLNALSYSSTFDLLHRDRELRAELLGPYGWADVDQDVVLRCLKLRVGANIYKTNPDEVSERIRNRPEVLDETFRAIARSAQFLASQLGITNPNLVPYQMQFVSLAGVMFDEYETDPERLRDWFWLSTYTEAFGSSARQSENAMEDLQRFVRSGKFTWTLKPPTVRPLRGLRIDFRAARVKALALALAARSDGDQPGEGVRLLDEFGRDAFYQIPFDGSMRGRAGNRFLVAPQNAAGLRAAILEGTLSDEEMDRHFLSAAALAKLHAGDPAEFLQLREQDMFAFERDRIIAPAASRLGVTIAQI